MFRKFVAAILILACCCSSALASMSSDIETIASVIEADTEYSSTSLDTRSEENIIAISITNMLLAVTEKDSRVLEIYTLSRLDWGRLANAVIAYYAGDDITVIFYDVDDNSESYDLSKYGDVVKLASLISTYTYALGALYASNSST